MSAEVTAWVWHDAAHELQGADLLVALALAEHANPEGGQSFPPVSRIARMARVSERTVQRCLKSLVSRGVIEVEQGAQRYTPNGYAFCRFRGDRGDKSGVTSGGVRGGVVTSLLVTERLNDDEENNEPPCVPPKASRQKPRTPLNPNWQPDEKLVSWTIGKGWDRRRIAHEVEKFQLYHGGEKQTLAANWPLTWQRWVLNGLGYDERGAKKRRYVSPAEMNRGGTGQVVL